MQRGIKLTLICCCEPLHSITKTPYLKGLAASTEKRRGKESRGQRLAQKNRKPTSRCHPYSFWKGWPHQHRRSPCVCLGCAWICLTPRVQPREGPHLGQFTDTKAGAQGSVWCHNWYTRSPALYFQATNHVLLCKRNVSFQRVSVKTKPCYVRSPLTDFFERLYITLELDTRWVWQSRHNNAQH